MAGNKRTFSQTDDCNDKPSPKTLDEILVSFETNNFQDSISTPERPSEEDLIMLDAFNFQQAAPSDNSNNNDDTDFDTAMMIMANDDGNGAEPQKPPRKRRRKGDPEPDHTALVREKTQKQKRCGQACDRCHMRRFRCDEIKGPCFMCLRAGHRCVMTNRATGEPIIRGGGEGVVVNFDDIQNENEEVKEKNEKLNDELEQLQIVNGKLQRQLQYYQNLASSLGAGPSRTPVQAPMQDDTARVVSFQGANDQDARHGQVNCQGSVNTQNRNDHTHQIQNPTPNAPDQANQPNQPPIQGTSHSLKTLNQGFQIPPLSQNQTFQYEDKDAQHQDFPNARVLYRTTHDYPFNFPQGVPHNTQGFQQPVAGYQNAGSQRLGFLNDPQYHPIHNPNPSQVPGEIKTEDDNEVKFGFESGFCWTSPLPAAFSNLETVKREDMFSNASFGMDNATKHTPAANAGDISGNPYEAQDLSSPEILALLLAGMEEGLSQQKQSQPVQELEKGQDNRDGGRSDNIEKEENQGQEVNTDPGVGDNRAKQVEGEVRPGIKEDVWLY